jgi:hypothetical protein
MRFIRRLPLAAGMLAHPAHRDMREPGNDHARTTGAARLTRRWRALYSNPSPGGLAQAAAKTATPTCACPSAPFGPRPHQNRARPTDATRDPMLTECLRLGDKPRHPVRRVPRRLRTRTGNPHPLTRHLTDQGPPMKIPAPQLAIGDILRVNDWHLRVIAVEREIGTAVLTAEFNFLLHFTRDDTVDVITRSGTPSVAA